jgi:hypothetical protein
MNLADSHLYSWTDWYFGGFLQEHSFNITDNARKLFSRSYAKAIAGYPKKMNYDVETKKFDLCFEQVDNVTNPVTEIFIPFSVHYLNGIDIEVTPNLDVLKVDEINNEVLVRNRKGKDNEKEHTSIACVHISPK